MSIVLLATVIVAAGLVVLSGLWVAVALFVAVRRLDSRVSANPADAPNDNAG